MGQNAQILHQFIEGLRQDFDPNAESNKSYQEGINGRLYSNGGTLSYSSLEGTTEIIDNNDIVKYMGYWPFIDELIVFVKRLPSEGFTPPNQGSQQVTVLETTSFNVDLAHTDLTKAFDGDMDTNTTKQTYTVPTKTPISGNVDDYNDNFSCVGINQENIDYNDYFTEKLISAGYEACFLENEVGVPENNTDFTDAVYSITKDENGNFLMTLLYEGYLNIPLDGKIVTYGINEGNYKKSIYFTDYENEFRVLNRKDKNLSLRSPSEFSVFQGGIRLSPQIHAIDTNGEIIAGTVFYTYRLITENGQTTQFAPPSKELIIAGDSGDFLFQGGGVGQSTDKHVTLQINVPDYYLFSRLQVVALEYHALNALSAIRDLGTRAVQEVNYFEHYGNESESLDVTSADVFERKANWRYCSGIDALDNILFASGIRNEPVPNEILELQRDFALRGWDASGNTHNCLMNPDPTLYRYIDPKNTDNYYYINKKRFNTIQVFGNYTCRLVNLATGDEYENSFTNSVLNYTEQVEEIYAWLNDTVSVDGNFATWFPNLTFDLSGGNLFFLPGDDLIPTDFADYVLKFNTTQVVQDVDEDIEFTNLNIGTNNLIYGAISQGYNRGNGVEVLYETEAEEVLSRRSNAAFPSDSPLLNLKEPSLTKGWMKGEIYRIGMRIFDVNGTEQFVIPFGDIMIPKMGETQLDLDAQNNVITLTKTYRNSYYLNNKLYAERIKLRIRVRFSCEAQKFVDSYQIMYVPRDEANRTILCQGISAPLERYNTYDAGNHIVLYDQIANKWNLPFNGGPTYDTTGLERYDIDPYNEDQGSRFTRVHTHRSLMYFDSPDLIYSKISDQYLDNGNIQRVAKLNTDHSPGTIRSRSDGTYPKFSRKIFRDELSGDTNLIPWEMNVSVFSSERPAQMDEIEIDYAQMLNPGDIIPGSALGVPQDVSNHAMTLGREQWFFSWYARESQGCSGLLNFEDGASSELWNSNNISRGYRTAILKASANVFTYSFIDQNPFYVDPEYHDPYGGNMRAFDTHGLFNITLDRKDSIYGGRTEDAFSKNIYKPVSDTIPVLKTSNSAQEFLVEGDIYTTLWVRLKNDYNDAYAPDFKDMNNSGGCNNADEEEDYTRSGAWAYAFVVESEVEPRLNPNNLWYRDSEPYNFGVPIDEFMNEAYFQDYPQNPTPTPFLLKEDPNLLNAVSSSQTKITGDPYDAWTIFPANNLYELEKDKGPALNIVLNVQQGREDLYVIQEKQTSRLNVNPRTMVQTDQGNISIQQSTGDGGPIVDHQIVSNFGTLIRRAVVKNDFGFCFVDETRNEFVKISKPLLIANQLSFLLRNITTDANPIIDTDGYHDDNFKETNIRITWRNGTVFTLSYNEAFGVFNGKFEYDNDLFMMWNSQVYAAKKDSAVFGLGTREDQSSLHNLNNGVTLRLFGEDKTMKIGVTTYLPEEKIAIFKAWAGKINIKEPFVEMTLRTSTNQFRVISGNHHRYKVRESLHSVPLKNRNDIADLRGQWLYMEVEIARPITTTRADRRIDVFSFINYLRNSYQ